MDRTLLAVINPTRDLPYAAIEGEAVAACFAPAARRVLTEGEANEEAVVSAARDGPISISPATVCTIGTT